MRVPEIESRLESHRKESEKFIRFLETGAMGSKPKSIQQQIQSVCQAQMKLRDELEFLQQMLNRI